MLQKILSPATEASNKPGTIKAIVPKLFSIENDDMEVVLVPCFHSHLSMSQDLCHRLEDAELEAFPGDRLNEVITLIWAQPDERSVQNLGVALGLLEASSADGGEIFGPNLD